ncbi:PH domain-containing protein [Neobacillus terrae]|uniref:PH domain-containing protein n=1 Tax=Neobacillus terrae TaxID=3034837 RepID=UPI00140B30E8|nr:PH domain-containing protein [Neobacillus terrae]NHM32347.1 hypothetical protein [Neobacillus terrae]
MKISLEAAKEHLKNSKEVLSSLFCTIETGYISRSGILIATTEKILFCADYMFGKGLKWEFEYSHISRFSETSGIVLDRGPVPFIKKLVMNYKDEFIVFTNFSTPAKVSDFLTLVQSKLK